MADEDVAPSRAEIESMLWVCSQSKMTKNEIQDLMVHYLKNRSVSERGIASVLGDLHTYTNYLVEEENAQS
jgi:DNA-binding ferritin-like protein (Dps family)